MDSRTQIRNKLITMLNDIPQVYGSVFYDYLYALKQGSLPCFIVVTGNENYQNISIGTPFVIEKVLNVSLSIVINAKNDYQDQLDNYKNLIEKKINETNTLEGLVQSCYIQSVNQETDDDQDVPVTYTTIVLEITYRTMSNNPDVIL